MSYFFKCLVIIGVLISCQDNKSKPLTIPDTSKIDLKKKKRDSIQKIFDNRINNETVVSFYKAYGKLNTETKVRIETSFGVIEMELFNDTPLHRANFIHIVKRGFLSETCFYRVAKDFVIQGGNSDSFKMAKIKNRIGKFTLPAEFLKHRKHEYGTVAMARIWKKNPNKRSSPFEFYIVMNTQNATHLNGEHTVIGKVIKGMDVAEKINAVTVDKSEWPITDVCMKATIIK